MTTARHRVRLLAWGCLLCAAAAYGQTPPSAAPPPAEEPERPEYRARALPTDSFKPSEQVSEDYAIPFPADI